MKSMLLAWNNCIKWHISLGNKKTSSIASLVTKLVFPDLHFMTTAETVQLHAHIKMHELFEQQELTERGVIIQLLSTRDEHTKWNTLDRQEDDGPATVKKLQLDCFFVMFCHYHRCSSQLTELTLFTCTAEQGTLQPTSLNVFGNGIVSCIVCLHKFPKLIFVLWVVSPLTPWTGIPNMIFITFQYCHFHKVQKV